jgi:RNA polymerase sigma factor (sigma-70 family)
METSPATPDVTRSNDDVDIWAAAAQLADDFIGITAAGIRDLWEAEHPGVPNAEAPALVALALSADPSTAREEARERLSGAFLGSVVKRVLATHLRSTGAEDMRQTAMEGVWRGLNAYDPAKHRSPVATLQLSVLAALNDAHAARYAMTVPEKVRLRFVKACDAFPGDLEAAAEHADEQGLTTDEFWHIYRLTFVDAPPSVSAEVAEPDYAPLWEAATPDVTRDETVAVLLAGLSDRERRVIALRFGLDDEAAHTEDETAEVLGLTPRRVRQIQAAALDRLRVTSSADESDEEVSA